MRTSSYAGGCPYCRIWCWINMNRCRNGLVVRALNRTSGGMVTGRTKRQLECRIVVSIKAWLVQ
ncbi:hypothetical protein DEO72_LG4g202 [Vigna unguiculata]|uniref:Uncharacterized protein n=1 Tax=Vigna unguiculata TaxID=3917 RepID=A0A4D6LLC0_VIGUN|nr:hypothetical protein DEO72_LG4g202 [Vigna unguiculata]